VKRKPERCANCGRRLTRLPKPKEDKMADGSTFVVTHVCECGLKKGVRQAEKGGDSEVQT